MLQRLRFSVLFLVIVFSGSNLLFSQPWIQTSRLRLANQAEKKPGYFEVRDKFEAYWKDKEVSQNEEENAAEGGYQQFRRWEWFMKPRTFPSGEFFNPEILINEYTKVKEKAALSRTQQSLPPWSFVGPAVVPSTGGGSGRVNMIRFHPGNPDIMFIGAACGGIWKTVNGGASWSTNSDFLPSISIADIAINPRYPDSMYVATGDGYGYEVGGDFWGGTYSAGVMISTDGGMTWSPSGLSYSQTQSTIVQRLVVHPVKPEILIATTRNGIFRSVDGGASWSLVKSGRHFDIEFNSANPDIVYASSSTSILRSLNAGQTWTTLRSGLCGGRISIGVTPANPDYIYALCESGNFYRSTDAGSTFQTMTSPNTLTTFYGYYDAVLAVSPVIADFVVCGGVNVVKSLDGGNTWINAGTSVIHVDQKYLEFYPGSGSTLFATNDGGVYKSVNSGTTWSNISNNLSIKQYYRMSQSSTDPYFIMAGAQDNGTDRLRNGSWSKVLGGDGMECLIDYSDDNKVYASSQYGAIQKSVNAGASFQSIYPASGDWVTPYVIHPTDPRILYAGYSDLYKSIDGGLNWTIVSNSSFGNDLTCLALAPSNPTVIYAAYLGSIFRSDDGGVHFSNITSGLPVSAAGITYIAVSAVDPMKVWISLTGYSAGNKVFTSQTGGASWQNISGSLPNIPVNCIVHENFSNGSVYAGTDFGVYYRDDFMNDWQPFNAGLPNVMIGEMEIHYGIGKIRAATYGRGIWEADLISSQQYALDAGVLNVNAYTANPCDTLVSLDAGIRNFGSDTIRSLTLKLSINGNLLATQPWTGQLDPGTTVSVSFPSILLSPGSHLINITVEDPNGSNDQNSINDSRTETFNLNPNIVSLPVAEGFETIFWTWPPVNWELTDNAQLLKPDYSHGGFGNSSVSIYANCFDISSGTAFLSSGKVPFQSIVAPATLAFNLAYAPYSSIYHDSLIVEVSTDCGLTFSRIYAKGDDSLATAPSQTSPFVPAASEWRRETIDLNSFIGAQTLMVRFVPISGFGNNIYLDDINLTDGTSSVNQISVSAGVQLFPNPATGKVSLVYNMPSTGFGQAEIYDMTGRLVIIHNTSWNAGYNQQDLDISGLLPGIYLVQLKGKGIAAITKSLMVR